MSRALRWSEKWFRFGLWIVAFVFAGFLIGLGGNIVENLPRVEQRYTLENFVDQQAASPLRETLKESVEVRRGSVTARHRPMPPRPGRASTTGCQPARPPSGRSRIPN
jgi:hypothetical protein